MGEIGTRKYIVVPSQSTASFGHGTRQETGRNEQRGPPRQIRHCYLSARRCSDTARSLMNSPSAQYGTIIHPVKWPNYLLGLL